MNAKPGEATVLPVSVTVLRPAEAARFLQICERTLWRLTAEGAVPHFRVGRSVRYRRAALEGWLLEQERRTMAK